jgi:hypothetical protein
MVPDDTGDVDLVVQVLVALVPIQTVLERLADGDHIKEILVFQCCCGVVYYSTYVRVVQLKQRVRHNASYIPT